MNTYTETPAQGRGKLEEPVDLDGLLADAAPYVSSIEVDAEIAERQLVLGCERGCLPDGAAFGGHRPALTVLGVDYSTTLIRVQAEVKNYLAHEMIEELNRHHLDSLTHLELRCRKEEVSRRVNKLIRQIQVVKARKAA